MTKGTRRGVFFCAVAGDRTYLRFVLANDDWTISTEDDAIIGELGTCLRLIECQSEQEIWYPEWLQDRVYDFWETAQQDIWTEWMLETDPANLQHAGGEGHPSPGRTGSTMASARGDHASAVAQRPRG